MAKSLRVGIIGYGKAAFMHAEALKNIEEADLVGIQGRNHSKASTFAAKYGAKGFDNLSEMITRENIEMIVICTPHHRLQFSCALLKEKIFAD